MDRPVIILGAGGHARVLADVLRLLAAEVLGFCDIKEPVGEPLAELPYLGNDQHISSFSPEDILLINGLGSTSSTTARAEIFQRFVALGYLFASLNHPSAVLSQEGTSFGMGTLCMAGSVIGPGTCLEPNVLVNTRAVVEHDCHVGQHSHIATGAVVCGHCEIGQNVHIGAGSVINQSLSIGDGAIIASGSVVIADVPPNTLMAGVPAIAKRNLD